MQDDLRRSQISCPAGKTGTCSNVATRSNTSGAYPSATTTKPTLHHSPRCHQVAKTSVRTLLLQPTYTLKLTTPRKTGAELATCLQYSDCVFKDRNKPGDCLRPPLRDTLPPRCQHLQKTYAECRKGWVDMRKRFRGNRPITQSQELEADASGVSYQLYAGAPAFSSTDRDAAAAAAREEALKRDEAGVDPNERRS